MHCCMICSSARLEDFCTVPDSLDPKRLWQVRRCQDCGYGFTDPPVTDSDLGAYYPTSYLGDTQGRLQEFLSGTLQRTSSWKRELDKKRVVESFVPGGEILDVGCSSASFLLALGENWRRTGVEYIREVVELVRSHVPALEIHAGDLDSAGLKGRSFDAVTFWHVLEHLQSPREILRGVFSLMKPGGHLFVRVPRFDSWQAKFFRQHWYAMDVPRHLHHFSFASLKMLLGEAGFVGARTVYHERRDNFHCLKHSVLAWSRARLRSAIPYYAVKPALFGVLRLERWSGSPGVMTVVSQKPPVA